MVVKFCEKAVAIPGGTIHLRTGVPQCRDTGKSMIILPGRYAGISG
jgi:hypothetical protein